MFPLTFFCVATTAFGIVRAFVGTVVIVVVTFAFVVVDAYLTYATTLASTITVTHVVTSTVVFRGTPLVWGVKAAMAILQTLLAIPVH